MEHIAVARVALDRQRHPVADGRLVQPTIQVGILAALIAIAEALEQIAARPG